MGLTKKGILNIDGLSIPYLLKTERRNNVRFSIGRTKVNIKLPFYFTSSMINKELNNVTTWLKAQLKINDRLRSKFELKDYSQQTISVLNTQYTLKIETTNLKSNRIKLLANNILHIRLEKGLTDLQTHSVIQRLLSKVFSAIYLTHITKLVSEINDEYFQETIKSVKLKYNKSNWGSCSSQRNINLSTRLLLAPKPEIIRYVIIHELAHLKEMNHSPAFWNIVSDAMPDYKIHEKWLKQNGHLLDF